MMYSLIWEKSRRGCAAAAGGEAEEGRMDVSLPPLHVDVETEGTR